MASCILYHGPGARDAAVEAAGRIGHLMVPPLGDEGLTVEEARQAVELLQSSPIEGVGCLVIGPMNRASPKASDVLLKSIEDFDVEYVQPILWAEDLEDVTLTIRSRCLERWAWADVTLFAQDEEADALEATGRELVRLALAGDFWCLPDLVGKHPGREGDLITVTAVAIAAAPTEAGLKLWRSLRKVVQYRNPTAIELLSALLPEVP